MAAVHVLNTPELLSLILQHFEEHKQDDFLEDRPTKLRNRSSRSDLAKLALVNSSWFETATRVLWSYEEWGPTLRDLAKIRSSRQQIYASKIASIKIKGKTGRTLDTTALSFPRARRLRFLEIGRQDGLPVTFVKQYLRPSINSIYFEVWDNSFNKELLTGMGTQCPRLRSLRLVVRENSNTDITPEDFNEFVRKQSLECVFIGIEPSLVTKDLLSTLGGMGTLKNLSIITPVSLQQIPDCFLDEDVGFFKNLYQVDLRLEREAVSAATMAIRHASRAKLEIISPGPQDLTPMFSNFKHMNSLVDLAIYLKGSDLSLDTKDFGCIRTLKSLEYLVVRREPPSTHTPIPGLHDSILKPIFGSPRLNSFTWQMGWLDVSIKNLCKLSYYNPNLRHILLNGACDLEALTDLPGCLFPNLQTLILQNPVLTGQRGRIVFKRIAAQILTHAPQLKTLSFNQDPQSKVVGSWRRLKQQGAARCQDLARFVRPMNLEDMLECTVPKWRRELNEAIASRPDPRDPRFTRAEAPEPQTSSS
ncbi:hypothetical protein M436DRAFT_80757 [Aureobasidium namibiae CBS 147.97]|uniref:F-box domain-containing protein n=1 Tax=Aureobasidium namibiae CBS 147.97 TaxID=1043004 RepID=A0A074WME4_9PEZI|nr:uncharacterized protein M436DRAFT_80757 [Aureobasidium namibiae CBS 147.97]KEQ74323.1 hypothetical protein M436DRAFT_80757 [Aureobasidium namibiae CBS 147.97]